MTMLPHALADRIIAEACLPSDGRTINPVSVDTLRVLIARAIEQDRQTTEPDFDAIADKVLVSYGHGETINQARRAVLLALRYAQSLGARFKEAGPSEGDYAEAVGNAIETFCSTLKDKGYFSAPEPAVQDDESTDLVESR